MKVLLINSDLAKNRGDRAIAEGVIALIREQHPGADITGLSECAVRDRDWFGIDFLPIDAQSLNPFSWLQLAAAVHKADAVYWGGGEMLKNYTNVFGLWYWCKKMLWLRLFNREIYGVFQGIGPTRGRLSRWLVAFTVNRLRRFIVRDSESRDKLKQWGAHANKLIASTDPAVLVAPGDLGASDNATLLEANVDADLLQDFIAISPRDWFHYATGGLLPHRFRAGSKGVATDERNRRYRQSLGQVIDAALEHARHVLLVPMHMTQDVSFCEELRAAAGDNERVRVLDRDTLSPELLRKLLAQARLMIGFRLHANIIATSACVPSMNFYYVDKGRVYFDQIGQQRFAWPIESLLDEDFSDTFRRSLATVNADSPQIRAALEPKIAQLRKLARESFRALHSQSR